MAVELAAKKRPHHSELLTNVFGGSLICSKEGFLTWSLVVDTLTFIKLEFH